MIDNDNREFSLIEIYYTFKKHIKIFSYILFITLFASIYYTLVSKPVYSSVSKIMISEDQKSMTMLDFNIGSNRNYIQNEIEILKSYTTSLLTVKSLLNSKHKNNLYLFNTKEYEPVWYRTYLTFGLLDRFQNTNNFDNIEISPHLINRFVKKLNNSISIVNNRNTDAIIITVKSLSAIEAELIANTIVSEYMNRDLAWITGEMSHLQSFLISQLEVKELELEKIENKLMNFQEQNKIFSLDDNSQLILENLTQFESLYNRTLAEISIAIEKEEYLNNQLTENELSFSENVSNSINDRLTAMKEELYEYESRLISINIQYDENHSAADQIKSKISLLRNQIKSATREMILEGISSANPMLYRQNLIDSVISLRAFKSGLESKSEAYSKLVNEYDLKLGNLPEKLLEFTRLDRSRSIQSDTYGFMRKKLEESRIGEASKLGKIRIVDNAILNTKPIKPSKYKNIFLGIVFGTLFGMLFILFYEFFDNSIKTVEQIERRGLNLLTIIPTIRANYLKNKKKTKKYVRENKNIKKLERRLLTHESPKSPISEAYRSLRTSLMYSKKDEKSRIILVSSAGPGEGKTTTVANLAITYANLGKKTLLIDLDLRKPVLHKVFNIEKSPGMANYLSGFESLEKISCKTSIENLDLIPSGIVPPNPSEVIQNKLMKVFINNIREKYDIILFDSPPLIAVTDAFILRTYVDQFVLVVRSSITEKGALDRVLNMFKASESHITGVVLNGMSEENSYGSGYYYNYYQYYYGEGQD